MADETPAEIGEAFKRLAEECTDFSLRYVDWPAIPGVHWTCRAGKFMAYGSAKGRTAAEAVTRALALMSKRDAAIPRATWDEMRELLPKEAID